MDICIDFDGTCVRHAFPQVGEDIGAAPVLRRLENEGHGLILFTMRSNSQTHGNVLDDAVSWFDDKGISLKGVQENPTQNFSTSPKAYGQLYIDDSALGVPLIYPDYGKPYVDWQRVEEHLEEHGLLPSGRDIPQGLHPHKH
jgi:hypothetical protein